LQLGIRAHWGEVGEESVETILADYYIQAR
jgi:hypothetical protein